MGELIACSMDSFPSLNLHCMYAAEALSAGSQPMDAASRAYSILSKSDGMLSCQLHANRTCLLSWLCTLHKADKACKCRIHVRPQCLSMHLGWEMSLLRVLYIVPVGRWRKHES